MPFVVDNSVVIAWHAKSQATPYTEKILDRVAKDVAHVPELWVLEFANILRKRILARAISRAQAQLIIDTTLALNLRLDSTPPAAAEILDLALAYGLSAYDAAYLELALRLGVPLAAKDGPLKEAARAAGAGVV